MNEAVKPKTTAELVELFIQLRNAKSQAENVAKEFINSNYVEPMNRIEQQLLQILNTNGLDSVRGPSGTAYKHISTSVTVSDQREFQRHVIGAEAWDLIEWRASKTAVNEIVERGEQLPPGVNRTSFWSIGVRKS